MKIVHVCLTGGYTEGINYQENYLTRYQAKEGHDVYIITTQYCWHKNVWGPCFESGYKNEYGVKVIRLPYKYKLPYKINTYLGIFRDFIKTLDSINPDVIFIHNLQFQDLRKLKPYAKRHPNTVLYADNHSDFSNSARGWLARNLLYKVYWRSCAKSVSGIVNKFYGVLPARVDFLIDIYKLPADKCELLVMGADDDAVEEVKNNNARDKIRKEYGIQDDDFCIVTGGKIDSFKMQTLTLMEAVRDIDNPKLKLLIFGSIEDSIKGRFDSLCDGTKIQYLGWAKGNQSYEYFSAADLAVFPGRHSVYWEQVVGMGIPMICKLWPGTTHVDLGGNVIFLKTDQQEELENAILQVFNSPSIYINMKNIADGNRRKDFSYDYLSRISIEG